MKRIKYIFPAIIASLIFSTSSLNAQEMNWQTQRKVEYFFHQAQMANVLGNWDEVLDFLRFLYAIDPTNPDVLIELGKFFVLLGEEEYALDLFRRAVYFAPNHYEYNLELAKLSLHLGFVQEALDIYNRLLQLYPDRMETLFNLSQLFADQEEWQKAIDALNIIEENIGIVEEVTINKMHFYLMMENSEGAINTLRAIAEEYPHDPRFLVLIGDLYLYGDEYERALVYYEKAREMAPYYPLVIFSLVRFHGHTGNITATQAVLLNAITSPTAAIEHKIEFLGLYISILHYGREDLRNTDALFQTLFEQHPDATEINFVYANVLMMQERVEEAIEHFEIFTQANPENPAGHDSLLRIAIENEDTDKIIAIATEALRYVPGVPQFYFSLSVAKFDQGLYAEAQAVLKDALLYAEFPSPRIKSMFLGQIADLYHRLDNMEAAFEYYGKALELNPMNLHVLNNYAYFLALERRDLDRAERMSAITIREEPTNPTFLDTYGWVLFQQGMYNLARVYLEQAMRYSADEPNATIAEQYGDVLYRTGNPERALEMWIKARELGGDSEELNRKIETGSLE